MFFVSDLAHAHFLDGKPTGNVALSVQPSDINDWYIDIPPQPGSKATTFIKEK